MTMMGQLVELVFNQSFSEINFPCCFLLSQSCRLLTVSSTLPGVEVFTSAKTLASEGALDDPMSALTHCSQKPAPPPYNNLLLLSCSIHIPEAGMLASPHPHRPLFL